MDAGSLEPVCDHYKQVVKSRIWTHAIEETGDWQLTKNQKEVIYRKRLDINRGTNKIKEKEWKNKTGC